MSVLPDANLRNLNDCGCCEDLYDHAPTEVWNDAGLSAIAYRVGTHAGFKRRMLASLSRAEAAALEGLTTRDDDDFAIALLDAWATVADVLTFYQERIANESYLRTATERVSIRHLARLIGYQLRPGVAAGTYLAFTIEEKPGLPEYTTIEIGTKVQSLPGPGELPQIFETIEKIEATADLNAMRPRLTRPPQIETGQSTIWLKGTATNLEPGDGLIVARVNSDNEFEKIEFCRVNRVVVDRATDQTRIDLDKALYFGPPFQQAPGPSVSPWSPVNHGIQRLPAVQYIVKTIMETGVLRYQDLTAISHMLGLSIRHIIRMVEANIRSEELSKIVVFPLCIRAALFGHNAPDWLAMPDNIVSNYPDTDIGQDEQLDWPVPWPEDSLPVTSELLLDKVYDDIRPRGWIVVVHPEDGEVITRVRSATVTAEAKYTLSGQCTKVELDGTEVTLDEMWKLRRTTVYAQGDDPLELAEQPVDSIGGGNTIELDREYEGLRVGQTLIVSGESVEAESGQVTEVAILNDVTCAVTEGPRRMKLTLSKDLEHTYRPETVTICGNVAKATHGETCNEILGSGDSSRPYQRFALRQPPLTHISSSNPSGAESTLRTRVNDVEWHEVPTLHGRGSRDRVFVARTNDDGQTIVQFGDGLTGARLPTGQENVKADYRKGIGLEGLVKADQLSVPMTRPLGLKEVTNPLPATGAADPESRDDARRNAPMTALTLDRIVSLKDYEDFARAFSGVAKALATWTWTDQRRGVFITVAGPKGAPIYKDSELYRNLVAAVKKSGDPYVPLRIESYSRSLFWIDASVKVHPDHREEKVLAETEKALRTSFSFDARSLGQSVLASEVIAVIQGVPGVVAVKVHHLYKLGVRTPKKQEIRALIAEVPREGSEGFIRPAELITLHPEMQDLGTMP